MTIDIHSHSLGVTLDYPTFFLWLSAMVENPSFSATNITYFSLFTHTVRVDSYAALHWP